MLVNILKNDDNAQIKWGVIVKYRRVSNWEKAAAKYHQSEARSC